MIENVYAGPDSIDCQGYAYRDFYLYPIAEAGIVIGHREEGGEPIMTVISLEELARRLLAYRAARSRTKARRASTWLAPSRPACSITMSAWPLPR